jgi:hypothetical protein
MAIVFMFIRVSLILDFFLIVCCFKGLDRRVMCGTPSSSGDN